MRRTSLPNVRRTGSLAASRRSAGIRARIGLGGRAGRAPFPMFPIFPVFPVFPIFPISQACPLSALSRALRIGLLAVLLAALGAVAGGIAPGAAQAQTLSQPQSQAMAPQPYSPAPKAAAPEHDIPPSVEQLAGFMSSDIYQELILSQWQRQSMEICGEPSIPGPLRHAGLALYADVRFEGEKPVSGVWADRYRGQACGRERQFNFLFSVQGGKVMIQHMLPGRTECPPRLQVDAMKLALPRLMARHKGCETMIPVDSEIERAPKHVNDAWSEIWVFDACGKLAATRVTFTPDGKGGTYFQVE